MPVDRFLFVRALDPRGDPSWEFFAVNDNIEDSSPGTHKDLLKGRTVPPIASLLARLQPAELLCVDLGGAATADRGDWINALFPVSHAERAEQWLGPELTAVVDKPFSDFQRARRDASGARFRRWTPLIPGGDRSFSPAIVHVFAHQLRELGLWQRVARGQFLTLQRHLSEMIAKRKQHAIPHGVALEAARQQLDLLSLAAAAERVRDAAQSADAEALRLIVDSETAEASRADHRRVRHGLAKRARELHHLHMALSLIRHGPTDITFLADYEPDARQTMLRQASLSSASELLSSALSATSGTLSIYSDALVSEDAARNARFQALASVVASALLAPALVAGLYGSNVSFPGAGTRDGFWAMLCWMAVGALGVWTLMRRFQNEAVVPLAGSSKGAVLMLLGVVGLVAIFLAALLDSAHDNLRVALGTLGAASLVIMGIADRH